MIGKILVTKIVVTNGVTQGVEVNGSFRESDIVLSGADYHHTETLLDTQYRMYPEKYWKL